MFDVDIPYIRRFDPLRSIGKHRFNPDELDQIASPVRSCTTITGSSARMTNHISKESRQHGDIVNLPAQPLFAVYMHIVENWYLDVHIHSIGRTIEDTLGEGGWSFDDATMIVGYSFSIICRDILDIPLGAD
jgi:hypothetical protein